MPLNDVACKNAECPPDKARARFADSGGLYLEVVPTGGKHWRWKYGIEGKPSESEGGRNPPISDSLIPEQDSVPDGTGVAAMPSTKDELWKAGKSLLSRSGMPQAQCGSFIGKLTKDHGDEAVLAAVRAAVVERPADPAAWIKASCARTGGQRSA